jgi:Asp-tRNA(Asn)/Glu-tRNA(Gln) amidotransferase A subunit family amidase
VVLDRAARFTGIWNLTGCPVVSLPCGLSPTGWPIALQVVAPPHQDALALAVAGRLEERLALSRTALEPAWAREEWARSRAT